MAGAPRNPLAGVRWSSPQLLLALGLVLLAMVQLVAALWGTRTSAPSAVEWVREEQRVAVEVPFVVVDVRGLERPAFAVRELVAGNLNDERRLNAALAALVVELQSAGVWPAELAAPLALLFEVDRRRIAVVDVPPLPASVRVGVGEEWAALRSLLATVRAVAAPAEVRFTVGGEETLTLWGSVALPR